jgi:bifunctional DNase/RNase
MSDAPTADESEARAEPLRDAVRVVAATPAATTARPLVDSAGDPLVETAVPVDEVTGVVGSEPVVEFRVMIVESVLFDLVDASPLVHLMEAEEPFRYMAIPIALPEATALNSALAGIEGRRPSTHELFSSVLARLQCDVIAVRIVRNEAGVYYAEIDVMSPRGREIFDCRTSDGLILALRQSVPAPVLCAEVVLASLYAESN